MSIVNASQTQQRVLTNLIKDISVLNEDQMNFIPKYYARSGLKTQILFLQIDMKKQLIQRVDGDLKRQFDSLKEDCIEHLEKRIKQLNKKAEAPHIRFALEDIIFACQEIDKLALNQWTQKETDEIREFQETSLSEIIVALGLSPIQESEMRSSFQALQEAVGSNNFANIQQQLDQIQQHLANF